METAVEETADGLMITLHHTESFSEPPEYASKVDKKDAWRSLFFALSFVYSQVPVSRQREQPELTTVAQRSGYGYLPTLTFRARPTAILIAGANGAGKTTFARQFLPLIHPGVAFMNADEIQRESSAFTAPVAAGRELLRRISAAELSTADFAVETTLSSRTYIGRVRRWNASGYHTVLHFIEVPSADFAVARVRARVASGGHDIPEPDIRRRFERGRTLFADVYQSLVRSWYLWASDANGLRLVRKNP